MPLLLCLSTVVGFSFIILFLGMIGLLECVVHFSCVGFVDLFDQKSGGWKRRWSGCLID